MQRFKSVKKPVFFIEFKQSLKNFWAEELIDLALFRPLAFLLVKILAPLPITPNQISLAAMICGIAGGCAFAGGSRRLFIIGGLLYGFSTILDCCDGMIARLKKNGTLTGRIVDGLVDYVTSASVYIGLGIGLSKARFAGALSLPFNPWLLVLLACASHAIHAVLSDKYRNGFLNQMKPTPLRGETERAQFSRELERLKSGEGHGFDRALIRIYLLYLQLQTGKAREKAITIKNTRVPRFSAIKALLWNIIGPSTHVTFLIAAAFLFNFMVYFIFVIGFCNIWTAGLLMMEIFTLL